MMGSPQFGLLAFKDNITFLNVVSEIQAHQLADALSIRDVSLVIEVHSRNEAK